jgi:uncharacterized RDD family membrane protein YckC
VVFVFYPARPNEKAEESIVSDPSSERIFKDFVTPEALPLRLELGSVGSRMAAFLVDMVILIASTIVLALLFRYLGGDLGEDSPIAMSLLMLVIFFLWNGYFIFFELLWQGRTPGKRSVGLRVMARHGGPLTTGAVLTRNFMRELEFFLPLQFILAPEHVFPGVPVLFGWLAGGWAFAFLAFPMANREKSRVGDLLAGTVVVVQPETRLRADQADATQSVKGEQVFQFTEAQLDMYGIKELKVLEDILHGEDSNPQFWELAQTVCKKIRIKIGWSQPIPSNEYSRFLHAFYRAQRRRLEHRMLLGERREHKKSGRLGGRTQ